MVKKDKGDSLWPFGRFTSAILFIIAIGFATGVFLWVI